MSFGISLQATDSHMNPLYSVFPVQFLITSHLPDIAHEYIVTYIAIDNMNVSTRP